MQSFNRYQPHYKIINQHPFSKYISKTRFTYGEKKRPKQIEINPTELNKLPKNQTYIAIANQPFGKSTECLLNGVLKQNNLHIITKTSEENLTLFLHKIRTILNKGISVCVFPESFTNTKLNPLNSRNNSGWDFEFIQFMCLMNIPIVPIYINFQFNTLPQKINNWYVHVPSLAHLKKDQNLLAVRIGEKINPSIFTDLDTNYRIAKYLRTRLYALRNNEPSIKYKKSIIKESIIAPIPSNVIKYELESIRKEHLLFTRGDFEIFYTPTLKIPQTLIELGRLREITFREVGEGTNKSIDIDTFDNYYNQLIIWHKKELKIVGAYRLGLGKDIISKYSKKGFYVSTLFHLDNEMIPILNNTIELGRSFVIKEFQQKPLPLFILWQGILEILLKHPEYKYLIGPLSISNNFSQFSKELIIAFIKKNYFNHQLSRLIRPHKKFVLKTNKDDISLVLEKNATTLNDLDRFISDIEPGYLKFPVLLKQYIKQNAKILGFNVDPTFNNSLDGLMMLDLKDLPKETIEFLGGK